LESTLIFPSTSSTARSTSDICHAVLPDGLQQLVGGQAGAAHIRVVHLAVVDQHQRLALHYPAEARNAVHTLLEQGVDHEQRRRGHQSARQGWCPTHHGVLHGVAEQHDEHQVRHGQLRDLRLSEQADGKHDERYTAAELSTNGNISADIVVMFPALLS
jgi:hypothetical protein